MVTFSSGSSFGYGSIQNVSDKRPVTLTIPCAKPASAQLSRLRRSWSPEPLPPMTSIFRLSTVTVSFLERTTRSRLRGRCSHKTDRSRKMSRARARVAKSSPLALLSSSAMACMVCYLLLNFLIPLFSQSRNRNPHSGSQLHS